MMEVTLHLSEAKRWRSIVWPLYNIYLVNKRAIMVCGESATLVVTSFHFRGAGILAAASCRIRSTRITLSQEQGFDLFVRSAMIPRDLRIRLRAMIRECAEPEPRPFPDLPLPLWLRWWYSNSSWWDHRRHYNHPDAGCGDGVIHYGASGRTSKSVFNPPRGSANETPFMQGLGPVIGGFVTAGRDWR